MSSFTLATYNIQYGKGADGRFDLGRIAAALAGADVVALQEVAQHWRRSGWDDQVAELGRRLGFETAFGTGFDLRTEIPGPDGRPAPARRTFGNLVASRWPIRSTRTLLLPKHPLVGVMDVQRSVTEAVIDIPDGPVRVYSTHLSHISSGQRLPQAAALLELIETAPATGAAWDDTAAEDWTEGWATPLLPEPAILAGDFNAGPASPEYALLCGELDPGRGRLARRRHLVDAWVQAGHGAGDAVTCPANSPGAPHIDHVFVTRSLAAAVEAAWIDDRAAGSDHYPVFVRFRHPSP